jgi:hypothetical protein
MNRYHKKVYTAPEHWRTLKTLTEQLNRRAWGYSEHCLDMIKDRAINCEAVLRFIKDIILEPSQIFEYYLSDIGEPIKVIYRINFNQDMDLILVVSNTKKLITIYINSCGDTHITLRPEQYVRG